MQAGALVIILYSLSTLTTAILQGLGKLREPLIHNVIALVIHTIVLYIMLRVQNLNIYAVLYANVIFALIVCILNALKIQRFIFYRQEYRVCPDYDERHRWLKNHRDEIMAQAGLL